MKKNLLALLVMAAALAGCTKTEMVDRSGNTPIGFANAYIGHPVDSRAVSLIEKANISEFIVYGGYTDMTHVFNGVSVTGTPETDDWTYGTTRYWVAGQTYKFAAYAPAAAGSNGTVATDFANGALNFTGYTSDPTHQSDLIYATAGQTTDNPLMVAPDKIQFKFSHLLSMIKFTFNSGFGNDITVTVENLKVSGMVSQGDYTGSTAFGAFQRIGQSAGGQYCQWKYERSERRFCSDPPDDRGSLRIGNTGGRFFRCKSPGQFRQLHRGQRGCRSNRYLDLARLHLDGRQPLQLFRNDQGRKRRVVSHRIRYTGRNSHYGCRF